MAEYEDLMTTPRNPTVNDYLTFSETLISRCKALSNVQGTEKLERKIRAEIKFLLTLQKKNWKDNQSHLQSTNLCHFASLLDAAERLPGVVSVLQPFKSSHRESSLVVDVVAGYGFLWVKVVARKAQALHLIWAGQGQFNDRNIVLHAEEYLSCCEQNQKEFQTPQICFAFYNQVTVDLANFIERLSVHVCGQQVPVDSDKVSTTSSDLDQSRTSSDFAEHESKDSCSREKILLPSTETLESSHLAVKNSVSNACVEREELENNHSTNRLLDITSEENNDQSSIPPLVSNKDNINSSSTHVTEFSSSSQENHSDLFLSLVVAPPDFSTLQPLFSTYHLLTVPDKLTEKTIVSNVSRVNLDITSLIASVSNVTNGGCNFSFQDNVLSWQAQEERQESMLPALEDYIKGKELFVCRTALEGFLAILELLGGPKEKRRWKDLQQKVTVVDDTLSERTKRLKNIGKIKQRSKVIFGSGDAIQAVTVTSNSGFVRAARNQGVNFSVFLIPARALTEMKEASAKHL